LQEIESGRADGVDGNGAPRGWPLVVACLAVLALAGWSYLSLMVADMLPIMDMTEAGPGMGLFNAFNIYAGLPADARAALAVLCLPTAAATFGMPAEVWALDDAAKVFLMWLMMALAMMLPSATPMLKTYMARRVGSQPSRSLQISTLLAAFGYLSIWAAYAVAATAAQWVMTLLNLMTPMMAPVSLAFTASILIAAGIYQFTPAKQACLIRCWYPRFSFLAGNRLTDAYREGLVQGLSCLGCCWAVMTVMFAVGVMNVLWIAILGLVMAVEKTFPSDWIYKLIGVFLLAWGGALAAVVYSGSMT
jgi:predicted metal-binding membrane protein